MQRSAILKTIARVISVITHPQFVSRIWILSFFQEFDLEFYAFICFAILLPTGISVYYFQKVNPADPFLIEKGFRFIPLFAFAVSLIWAGIIFTEDVKVLFLALMFGIIEILLSFAGILYKLSLHMAGFGAALAFLFSANTDSMPVWFTFLGLLGLTYWARKYLNAHTHAELAVGYISGFVFSFIALYLVGLFPFFLH